LAKVFSEVPEIGARTGTADDPPQVVAVRWGLASGSQK
jgi:hypothetical protein